MRLLNSILPFAFNAVAVRSIIRLGMAELADMDYKWSVTEWVAGCNANKTCSFSTYLCIQSIFHMPQSMSPSLKRQTLLSPSIFPYNYFRHRPECEPSASSLASCAESLTADPWP